VLALASEMAITKPRGYLSDALHVRLSEHFDDAEIFEMGMAMAVLGGMAKFLFCFDLATREDSCQLGKL